MAVIGITPEGMGVAQLARVRTYLTNFKVQYKLKRPTPWIVLGEAGLVGSQKVIVALVRELAEKLKKKGVDDPIKVKQAVRELFNIMQEKGLLEVKKITVKYGDPNKPNERTVRHLKIDKITPEVESIIDEVVSKVE